jgi:hypothetical protein
MMTDMEETPRGIVPPHLRGNPPVGWRMLRWLVVLVVVAIGLLWWMRP